jgi:hypothetical protein
VCWLVAAMESRRGKGSGTPISEEVGLGSSEVAVLHGSHGRSRADLISGTALECVEEGEGMQRSEVMQRGEAMQRGEGLQKEEGMDGPAVSPCVRFGYRQCWS